MSCLEISLRFSVDQEERKLFEKLRFITIGFELFCGASGQFYRFIPGVVNAQDGYERRLSLPLILADRLARLLPRTDNIEKIVGDLKQKTEIPRIVPQVFVVRCRRAGEYRSGFAGKLEQRAGLHRL